MDLTRADLSGAQLPGANLASADFTGARLTSRTDFTGARLSKDMPVPEGWMLDPASRELRRASQSTGDSG